MGTGYESDAADERYFQYNDYNRAYIPDCFKQGIIIPIPRGGGKDRSVKANHRPIALLSVLYKLYEKVLLVRIEVERTREN